MHVPRDGKQWDIVEALDNFPFHLFDVGRARKCTVAQFSSPPVLLDEIELAMIFGIEIAEVTASLDILLQGRFLGEEIRLVE